MDGQRMASSLEHSCAEETGTIEVLTFIHIYTFQMNSCQLVTVLLERCPHLVERIGESAAQCVSNPFHISWKCRKISKRFIGNTSTHTVLNN